MAVQNGDRLRAEYEVAAFTSVGNSDDFSGKPVDGMDALSGGTVVWNGIRILTSVGLQWKTSSRCDKISSIQSRSKLASSKHAFSHTPTSPSSSVSYDVVVVMVMRNYVVVGGHLTAMPAPIKRSRLNCIHFSIIKSCSICFKSMECLPLSGTLF